MLPVDHRLASLLGRWHQWRRHYSHERAYARCGGAPDPEDALELLLMHTVEVEIAQLDVELQRALQQLARAECLGVEIGMTSAAGALTALAGRLLRAGVL